MSGNAQPLDQQFAIVDAQGRPTLYFIQWAQQRQIDITNGITNADLVAYLLAHKLVAGTGIGLAPDGDLASSPTITAKVQEILDQISATRGTVLYRGAAGWAALAPGVAGNFLKTNGAGADPAWAAAGGGNWWAGSKPVAASFPTRINTANPITLSDDADIGLIIDAGTPVNDSLLRIAARAGPPSVGDFAIKARITANLNTTANCGAAICLVDTVGNRVNFWGRFSNNPVNAQRWTLPTGLNSNQYTSTTMGDNQTGGWFGFSRVGATLNFLYSADGKNWTILFSEGATAWLTNSPNFVGLCTNYQTALGSHIYLSCDYWSQTW